MYVFLIQRSTYFRISKAQKKEFYFIFSTKRDGGTWKAWCPAQNARGYFKNYILPEPVFHLHKMDFQGFVPRDTKLLISYRKSRWKLCPNWKPGNARTWKYGSVFNLTRAKDHLSGHFLDLLLDKVIQLWLEKECKVFRLVSTVLPST